MTINVQQTVEALRAKAQSAAALALAYGEDEGFETYAGFESRIERRISAEADILADRIEHVSSMRSVRRVIGKALEAFPELHSAIR